VNTAVQKQEPIDLQEIDFDDTPVDPDVFTDEVDYDQEYDGVEGERRLNYQYTNSMNPTFPNTIIPFPNTIIPFPNTIIPFGSSFGLDSSLNLQNIQQ
jgi:hypothetical protein